MADITVDATVHTALHTKAIRVGPVWVGPDTAYVIYVDDGSYLVYQKTTDGGATWSSPVTVIEGTLLPVSIWYDRWTPGSVGRTIHCTVIDASADDIIYRGLDTVTDSLSTQVVVFDGAAFAGSTPIDIVRSRGGNLYVAFWGNTGGERGFYRSTDDGATWTSRAQVADGDAEDGILLMPGNETDEDDIWCIYWDRSADELSLKVYDNSANSWSETLILGSMVGSSSYYQMSAAPRHRDNHVILAAWNALSAASADLFVWDIGGSGDISSVGVPLVNTDESAQVAVLINQQNGDIYVAYLKGGTWEATVDAKYKKSTDGGTTWGSEQTYSEAAADDLRGVWAGVSIGADGGRFQPTFFNDDLDDLFVNVVNSILVEALVRPLRDAYAGASVDDVPSGGSAVA